MKGTHRSCSHWHGLWSYLQVQGHQTRSRKDCHFGGSKGSISNQRKAKEPHRPLFSFHRPLPGCAWVPRLQPAAPAGLSPSLQRAYSIASHPVRHSFLSSWFIHTAWKGAGAGLHNTNPRICSAQERGNWLADKKWLWCLSVQMVGTEHVTSGRRKIIKTRAMVTQGPVMVPPARPLISSQPHFQKAEQRTGLRPAYTGRN